MKLAVVIRSGYVASALTAVALAVACGSSSSGGGGSSSGAVDDAGPRGGEQVGQSCKVASECYPGLEAGALRGAAQCLSRVSGGYCTHLCTTDADCCAVPGECVTGFKQVCAPFESTGQMMCFLSCEKEDLHAAPDAGAGAPVLDDSAYCQTYVASDFGCRSTGGGKKNRKVCVPSGGGTSGDAATD
ncbi:MAG: hypothetical protein JNL38_38980 [Myxococcales bacterium]|nr:hypothetical protein [Myxococcales bacterium]